MMGLIDAAAVLTMSVKVRVFGTDEAGADISHLFEFTGVDWDDPGPIPNADLLNTTDWSNSLRTSTQVFASITNVVVEEDLDSGPLAAIAVWALLNPEHTYDLMKDACHVSEVLWDGLRLATIRDKRIIGTTVRDFLDHEARQPNTDLLFQTIAGGNSTIYVEDFREPRLGSLLQPFDVDFQIPSFVPTLDLQLPWYNFSRLHTGLHSHYVTRGLPVFPGSGKIWSFTGIPRSRHAFQPFFNEPISPFFSYWNGTTWIEGGMLPVPGFPGTFQITLLVVPLRVRLALVRTEHITAFALYG